MVKGLVLSASSLFLLVFPLFIIIIIIFSLCPLRNFAVAGHSFISFAFVISPVYNSGILVSPLATDWVTEEKPRFQVLFLHQLFIGSVKVFTVLYPYTVTPRKFLKREGCTINISLR